MDVLTKLMAADGEGERLDRFELIAELASGGMATVFLARLSGVAGFQRLVAIKRLHPHLARDPEFIEMFLDEARLAARIHHPNVVPIQEVGESERGYYLVMDYVEGDTLARMLARAAQAKTTIPHAVVIRILLDVLAGLHAAHELKDDAGDPLAIVHRDVSPQNVLVGVDGVARLVDFGVARAASRLATTRSGQLKGKLAYMAPEQARGAPVDRRADIFSCGIVLWEALAMKRLFKGDGEAETLNRVLYDVIPAPSSVRADVPKTLEAICMKALDRDVDERWATALDLADALEKAAHALSCVGSVRDVASCLENVIGTEITQQREAVRAWLARSEPSGERSKKSLPPPPADSVTKIEGNSKSSPSRPSREPIDRGAQTIVERASAPPEKVSSVSSAVLQVKDPGPPSSAAAPQPKSRTGLVAAAIVAAAVLGGAAVWGATHVGAKSAASAASATTTATATATANPTTTTTAPPTATVDAPTPTATATASESATPPKPATKQRPTPRPSAKPRPTGNVPDDLGNNPYR